MRSRVRSLLILACAGMTAGGLSALDSAASADPPALHPLTFIDQRTGLSIRVQVDPSAPDAGHVTFFVPGLGTYSLETARSMRILSATSVVIEHSGPAVLRSTGSAAVERAVKLQTQLDPKHHTGEATLTEPHGRFHLVARPITRAGLDPVLAGVEAAITRNDAAALYPLLNGSLRRAYDEATFVASWQTRSASLGRVSSLERTGIGDVQVTDQGYAYVAVTYRAIIVRPAGTGAGSFTAYFLREPDAWRLWTTTQSE